jgi:hypothetical protein
VSQDRSLGPRKGKKPLDLHNFDLHQFRKILEAARNCSIFKEEYGLQSRALNTGNSFRDVILVTEREG